MAHPQKEKFEGQYAPTGEHVKFNREWGGVRFSDEQCQALLAGEDITFTAVSKAGKDYQVYGKLEHQQREIEEEGETKTIRWFGLRNRSFDPKVDADGKELPPESFAGHTFTESEKQMLADGEKLFIEDFVSKKGKNFAATVSFAQEPGGDRKKIQLDFGN